MKNLIKQASIWLQSDECCKGTIIERTTAVIDNFKDFIDEEKDEIENKNLSYKGIQKKIEDIEKEIKLIIEEFLRGKQQKALKKSFDIVKDINCETLDSGERMYKCRENNRFNHFKKDEMFHIPFDKRYLVGNQRFSLSGLPCLYLGGSSYICWEELGRKDFNTSNFCGYRLKEDKNIKVLDLKIPSQIENENQILLIVLALACSLKAERDSLFKPEYILPQSILHSLICKFDEEDGDFEPFCINYYSSHLLNGDADYFQIDFDNPDLLLRYVNYVFPAVSLSLDKEQSEKLKDVFKEQTETISFFKENTLDPEGLHKGNNNGDVYLNSPFGLMDALMDKKMDFTPKRKESDGIVHFECVDM